MYKDYKAESNKINIFIISKNTNKWLLYSTQNERLYFMFSQKFSSLFWQRLQEESTAQCTMSQVCTPWSWSRWLNAMVCRRIFTPMIPRYTARVRLLLWMQFHRRSRNVLMTLRPGWNQIGCSLIRTKPRFCGARQLPSTGMLIDGVHITTVRVCDNGWNHISRIHDFNFIIRKYPWLLSSCENSLKVIKFVIPQHYSCCHHSRQTSQACQIQYIGLRCSTKSITYAKSW